MNIYRIFIHFRHPIIQINKVSICSRPHDSERILQCFCTTRPHFGSAFCQTIQKKTLPVVKLQTRSFRGQKHVQGNFTPFRRCNCKRNSLNFVGRLYMACITRGMPFRIPRCILPRISGTLPQTVRRCFLHGVASRAGSGYAHCGQSHNPRYWSNGR